MIGEQKNAALSLEQELRNGVCGLAGLLQLLVDPDPTLKKRHIASCALEISLLLHRMLEARISAGIPLSAEHSSPPTGINVPLTIGDIAKCFEPCARLKEVRLLTELDDRLPCKVPGDPDFFYRVLFNLVENALSATDRGTVTIAARRLDALAAVPGYPSHLLIEVSDTGTGIDTDVLASLFIGPAASSAADGAFGHRIGLPSVARMVAHLRSHLMVESGTARGSRFFFALPLES